MPLDPPPTWGQQVAQAIKAIGVQAGTPVTDAQLEATWAAVKTIDTSQLGKADVQPGSFVAPSGGGPVSGTGGPVN